MRTLAIFRLALSFWRDARMISRAKRRLPEDQARAREIEIYRAGGARFRREALRLQGLVIKVGQFLSARTDILPLAFTRELTVLQDQVPAAPFDGIKQVVQEAFGQPLDEVFSSFDPEPVAAASLGQVHRAKLRADGAWVAVKVQRPGIEDLARIDLAALGTVMAALRRWTAPGRRLDTVRIFREFRDRVHRELDYLQESENLQAFQRNFADVPTVRIPDVMASRTRRRVLVMEFMSGVKLTDRAGLEQLGLNPAALARVLVQTYLQQIVRDGTVQIDPHPGNFLAAADGRIVFLDFGMIGHYALTDLTHFGKLLEGVLAQDAHAAVAAMDALGMVKPFANRPALTRAVALMIRQLTGTPLAPGAELDRAVAEFQDFLYEEPLEFPARYMFLGRAIGMLFGLVSALDPDLDWLAVLKDEALPWLNRRRQQDGPPWLRRVGDVVGDVLGPSAEALTETVGRRVLSAAEMGRRLPGELDRVLKSMEDGQLVTRPELTAVVRRLDRLGDLADGLTAMVAMLGSLLAGLGLGGSEPAFARDLAWTLFVLSAGWFVRARLRAARRLRRRRLHDHSSDA